MKGETLGIIGVGALARYCVAGLRHAGDDRRIILSPRNAQMAAQLAEEFDCEVMAANQSVANAADIVMLATRPEHAGEALSALELREEQLLLSVVAGLSIEQLQVLVGEHIAVARSMPVCCAEVGAGAMPLWPDNARARGLLARIGEVVGVSDEAQFELAFVASCANGWFHQFFAELEDWLVEAGFPRDQARTLALQSAQGASSLDLARRDIAPAERARLIATPGTYTLAGLKKLEDAGAFSALRQACDLIRARVEGKD